MKQLECYASSKKTKEGNVGYDQQLLKLLRIIFNYVVQIGYLYSNDTRTSEF